MLSMFSMTCVRRTSYRRGTYWVCLLAFAINLAAPTGGIGGEIAGSAGDTGTTSAAAPQQLPPPVPRVENLKSTQQTKASPLSQGLSSRGDTTRPQSNASSPPVPIRPMPSLPLTPGAGVSNPPGGQPTAQSIVAPETDRVEVKLEVSGKVGNPKTGTSNLKLEADLVYEEQIIQTGDAISQPVQALRLYENAEAKIWLNDSLIHPVLRDDRRYLGVYFAEGKGELFCPEGPLTRDELDLVDVLGNTAVIDLLLPRTAVREGSEWDVPDQVVSVFLGLETVTSNTVKCRVSEILPGGVIRVEMSGSLRGIVLGAVTQAELLARFQFPLSRRKIGWLGMVIRETRGASFVDHPFELTSRLQIVRNPANDPKVVKYRPGVPLTFPPLPEHLRLVHRDEAKGWQLTYDRKWYLVSSSPDMTVFRMVDRQGQVAQCNIAPLASRETKLTLASLRDTVKEILGENFGRVIDGNELTSPTGHQMFHVHVAGQVSDVPIHWIYYVMTTPDGKNHAVVFTVEEKTLERFGNGDRELVDGFEFLQPAEVPRISQGPPTPIR